MTWAVVKNHHRCHGVGGARHFVALLAAKLGAENFGTWVVEALVDDLGGAEAGVGSARVDRSPVMREDRSLFPLRSKTMCLDSFESSDPCSF